MTKWNKSTEELIKLKKFINSNDVFKIKADLNVKWIFIIMNVRTRKTFKFERNNIYFQNYCKKNNSYWYTEDLIKYIASWLQYKIFFKFNELPYTYFKLK